MSKRKAADLENEILTEKRPSKRVRIQQDKLDIVLSQGQTSLFRALKAARASERQKLGRRMKDARVKNDDETIARLDTEVAALKDLDLNDLSQLYLYRTVCKIKSVSESGALPSYVRDKVDKASGHRHDAAYSNVTSRLYTSNTTKGALEATLATVRRVVGLTDNPASNKESNRAGGNQLLKVDNSDLEDGSNSQKFISDESSDSEGYGQYEDILGDESSKESFGGDEDGLSIPSGHENSEDEDESQDDFEEISQTNIASSTAKERQRSSIGQATKSATNTVFIPSLMAGYISGTDSQPDSDEEKQVNLKERKNRRGQQARRAIWERKYGSNANHQKKVKENRDTGWDKRKGAVASDTQRTRAIKARNSNGRDQQRAHADRRNTSISESSKNNKHEKRQRKETEGKLHPSWEAARKRKQDQRTVPVFSGTKVKFN